MKKIVLFLFLIVANISGQISLDYYFSEESNYSKSIPTPTEFFGFTPGEWHLYPNQIVDYAKEIAKLSDRVNFEIYGYSHENRPLILLTISAAENLLNLEEIKTKHIQRTNPGAKELNSENPVVVWLGYSVHGNEPSGSNSVPLLLYHLAAGMDQKVINTLSNSVILLDININPDGLARFANWANMHKGNVPVSDPNNREHREYWPSGRTNHYWFDLNRDWLLLQHPESRARIKKFHEWKPNLLTDHHEMGTNSTFFFQPGIPSRNNPNTPLEVFDLTQKVAQYHADALDSLNRLYYSKESFDDFYFGKGSTYPDVNGGIGILFEQASSRGHIQESINGELTFPFTIKNQFLSSLSSIEAAIGEKEQFFIHQKQFFKESLNNAKNENFSAYVFGGTKDRVRTQKFLEILDLHQIVYFPLKEELNLPNHKYETQNSFVIPLAQNQYRLIEAMFDDRTVFQDSIFYDVSAWTMNYAFNLPISKYSGNVSKIIDDQIPKINSPGKFNNVENAYAYLIEWDKYFSPRTLNRLLKKDLRVKFSLEKITTETSIGLKVFDRGTLLIPVGIQELSPDELEKIFETCVEKDGVDVFAIKSGLTISGIDIGSPSFAPIKKSKIGLIVGDGISTSEAGELWHLIDKKFETEVTLLDLRNIRRIDFENYSTIILPDGNYSSIDSSKVNDLKGWLQKGGNLIAVGSSARWINSQKIVSLNFIRTENDKIERRPFNKKRNDRGAQYIAGTIFNAVMDLTNPICFGYSEEQLPVFKDNTIFIKPTADPYATPIVFSKEPLLAGYISKDNYENLKNSSVVITEKAGRGSVIIFTTSVDFRSFWYGTNKLMFNAIYFGSAL
ncbi:MAG: hypothetical protein K9G44_05805 [Melioribacteraceae bacterium]|nr:hypothetical protein [Melioribacteraceae bacterium]